MIKTYLKWSINNSKVSKLKTYGRVVSFGIPAYASRDGFRTCPLAGACAAVCYARQGAYVFKNVQDAREHNLKYARGNKRSFVRMAIRDLIALKVKLVRVHDSGDMFNSSYLNAWFNIARALPSIRFYTYTKMISLDWTKRPSNFAVTFSEGGLLDHEIDKSQSHSRIFASNKDRQAAGYLNGNRTDWLAVQAKPGTKIGLVYHGVKNLTKAQERFFS